MSLRAGERPQRDELSRGDSTAPIAANDKHQAPEAATPRLALLADVNLNIIDGSAIWLTSLATTLAGAGDLRLTIYLKAPEQRDVLTRSLRQLPGTSLEFPQRLRTIDQGLDTLCADHRRAPFDAVVLRGFKLAQCAAARAELRGRLWSYLTDVPQTPDTMTAEALAALGTVAAASEHLLCQTEELRAWFEQSIPEARGRCTLLPPMIPAPRHRKPEIGPAQRLRRIVYSGKFAPLWKPLEMIRALRTARERYDDLELHVFGDKIQNPPEQPDFQSNVRTALESTPGVVWHGAVSREELLDRLAEMDVAWAWRSDQLESNTHELSTKVLEYGAVGLPVILARNAPNTRVLGEDYPLFANSETEATRLLLTLDEDCELLQRAATAVRRASESFTFERVRSEHLADPLAELRSRARWRSQDASTRRQPLTVLIAGHDLKFLRQYIAYLENVPNVRVHVDPWQGHDGHDERASRKLLRQADVILCEWCLGNAAWYALHKSPRQRLLIRFHRQEQMTEYPLQLDLDGVDRIIFVSEHIRREAANTLGWPLDKLTVVPNYVHTADLDRPKLPDVGWNLGLLGICPALKRFDLALDILEALLERDNRYMLYVKGVMPWDHAWLWVRPAEREYYEQQFTRLRRSTRLRHHVVFDPPGNDVPTWFQKLGHILSVSDIESFHLAVAEGAASRALPWIIERPGAREIFDTRWIFGDVATLASGLAASEPTRASAGAAARDYVRARYDRVRVFETLNAMVCGADPRAVEPAQPEPLVRNQSAD